MLLRFWVAVLLGHAKVDDVHDVRSLGRGTPNEKVVGFDVAVDEVLLVDGLNARELCGVSDGGGGERIPSALPS